MPYNKLLISLACSSRTGEYWPSVVFVRTSMRSVRTATTLAQYSPVRPSRSVSKRLLTKHERWLSQITLQVIKKSFDKWRKLNEARHLFLFWHINKRPHIIPSTYPTKCMLCTVSLLVDQQTKMHFLSFKWQQWKNWMWNILISCNQPKKRLKIYANPFILITRWAVYSTHIKMWVLQLSYNDQVTAVISYSLGFLIFHFHITMSLQLGVHHLQSTHLSMWACGKLKKAFTPGLKVNASFKVT